MATIIEIISAHLRTIGADGLVLPDAECGCELADLQPCGDDFSKCQPGYRGCNKDEAYSPDDWAMYATQEAAEASKRVGAPGAAQ
jgi:hypothetical protein